MSPHRRMPGVERLGYVLLVLGGLVATLPAQAQPHASDPLPTPLFSVDRSSPLNTQLPGAAAAVLQKPGPGILFDGQGMGLYAAEDELDALSYDRAPAVAQKPCFLFLIGVDRASIGGVPPDPGLEAAGRPFNVTDQADRRQAAGDLYMSLGAFTPDGTATPGSLCAGRGSAGNNVLAVNQGDTGGVDQDLSPEKYPVQRVSPAVPQDDADSAAYPPTAGKGRDGTTFVERLFFSVSADSPSLSSLPGTSGADIFVDPVPTVGGNEALYASAYALGLLNVGGPAGDDIDALVVLDNGNGTLDPGIDRIIFSLARNSPSLGSNFSPADVFMSRGNGTKALFAPAVEFGLNPAPDNLDNLDCLEVWPISLPVEEAIYAHSVFRVWPGDYDRDGVLTEADCAMFDDCYSGFNVPYDSNGSMTHTVFVGPGPFFTPPNLTIEVGDTVRWFWREGGHNVVSGFGCVSSGAFNSGPASDVGSTFDVTFDEAFLNAFPVAGAVYHYCSQYDPGMTGAIHVIPNACAVFDLDFDGDVDGSDWIEFQAVYIEATDGDACLLTIPEFVDALLGNPGLPAHTCMADMNGNGAADGLDIQAYVDAILGP